MKNKKKSIFIKLLFTFLAGLSAFLLLVLFWTMANFGAVSLELMLFTISAPFDEEFLAGEAVSLYIAQFKKIIGITVVITLCYAFIIFILPKIAQIRFIVLFRNIIMYLTPVALIFALYLWNSEYQIARFFWDRSYWSTFIEENYVTVKPEDVVFPDEKRNLIIIILESVENTFNDPALFEEPVMPLLKSLQDENLSFRAQHQTDSSHWSVAGITNYMFGLPLLIDFRATEFEDRKYFLPGAISLLEVFESQGYHIYLTKGAEAKFEGLSRLFSSHSKSATIHDLSYFRNNAPDFDDIPNKWMWGLPDEYVYQHAKEYLLDLDKSKPFFMMFITVDTHLMDIHDSNFYFEPKWNDKRDGFYAADIMAYDFVRWIQAQDFYDNTTVLVMGDHLSYLSDVHRLVSSAKLSAVPKSSDEQTRTIFNAFINSARMPDYENTQERYFGSFDMAPTILESVGAVLPDRKFGLGTSLFSQEPTLFEKYGAEYYEKELAKRSHFYRSFR